MRHSTDALAVPSMDAFDWRNGIKRSGVAITLDDLLSDLWGRGIPVVSVDVLPSPHFQGLACVVENRPVILLGYKNDEPGRVAFVVAHEAGHIAAGDCGPQQPVVDEEDEIADDTEIERNADLFATRLLIGSDKIPDIDGENFRQLAQIAWAEEKRTGADASAVIFAWARKTGSYSNASMAVKALYRASGARSYIRKHFSNHVDLESATESDRSLLRCVLGGSDINGTTG